MGLSVAVSREYRYEMAREEDGVVAVITTALGLPRDVPAPGLEAWAPLRGVGAVSTHLELRMRSCCTHARGYTSGGDMVLVP